jgi:hypothetical protein
MYHQGFALGALAALACPSADQLALELGQKSKCLARSNKSPDWGKTTKKRIRQPLTRKTRQQRRPNRFFDPAPVCHR